MLTVDRGPIGIGDAVSAVWTATGTTEGGDDIVEPVFAPAEANVGQPVPNSGGAVS
jgi:hypothetical protein